MNNTPNNDEDNVSASRWSRNHSDDQFASERQSTWAGGYLITHIPNGGHPNLLDCIYTKSFMRADLI